MILQKGEKIHVVHRRMLEQEPHRHFVGVVEAFEGGLVRAVGYVFTVDRPKYAFIRRPEKRTRIISLNSGDALVNVIPPEIDVEKVQYKQEAKAVRVTDGTDWHLDLSEFAWM